MRKNTIIIAEAGVNHNGDLETAKKLIKVAADAGADFVKFQTFKAENLVSKKAEKAEYQSRNLSDTESSQFEMLQKLELSHSDHLILKSYCEKSKIKFFSTAFDIEGIHYLNSLGLKMFKVPSGEITNYSYLKTLADIGKPVILSTGMSSLNDISNALEVLLTGIKKENITILHCNTDYPTTYSDVNLMAMLNIKETFKVNIGYSDHTAGIEVPIAAVALGASIVEKHFTLDKTMPGPDHKASLDPFELKKMVDSIRITNIALSGSGKKEPTDSELRNLPIIRKSIHIKNFQAKGTTISEDNLIALRPGDGLCPMVYWNQIIGKKCKTDLYPYHKLHLSDIEK